MVPEIESSRKLVKSTATGLAVAVATTDVTVATGELMIRFASVVVKDSVRTVVETVTVPGVTVE